MPPARVLVPGELIFDRDNTRSTGCNIRSVLGVGRGLHYAAQQDLAVIAIDHNCNILPDAVLSKRALHFGYQEGIIGAFIRRQVVVMPLQIRTVVFGVDGTRLYGVTLRSLNLSGGNLSSRQHNGYRAD